MAGPYDSELVRLIENFLLDHEMNHTYAEDIVAIVRANPVAMLRASGWLCKHVLWEQDGRPTVPMWYSPDERGTKEPN